MRGSPLIRFLRASGWLGAAALLSGGAIMLVAHWWIQRNSARYIISRLADLPTNDVGLVLGTSAFTAGHLHNAHFDHRMAAAAALYRAKRVRHLLLSGDNSTERYDEPASMEHALLAEGIPAASLTRDDAGFRTLDSVVRARQVFGLRQVTLVTDGFHCYRGVFLARHSGLEAVAFPSQEVAMRWSMRSRIREWLADMRACLDVYVLRTRPKFLGKPIRIQITADA